VLGAVPPAQLGEFIDLPVRGQSSHPKTLRVARNHVERARTDRPGGTQYGYVLNDFTS
jgi:hypothetical protein